MDPRRRRNWTQIKFEFGAHFSPNIDDYGTPQEPMVCGIWHSDNSDEKFEYHRKTSKIDPRKKKLLFSHSSDDEQPHNNGKAAFPFQ